MIRPAIILLLATSTVGAGGIRGRTVVVEQVEVPTVLFFAPLSVPTHYGAPQYASPQKQEAPTEFVSAIRELTSLIKGLADSQSSILARLERLEGGQPPPRPEPEIPQIVSQQCGKCHSGEDPKGGIALADLRGDKGLIDRSIAQVAVGKMPTDNTGTPVQLAADARQEIVQALETMR